MNDLNLQASAIGGYFELATFPLNDFHLWSLAALLVPTAA
jgi:hypothetical protein